jgi:hypothetical protein
MRAVPTSLPRRPVHPFDDALGAVKPDVVSINTTPDTHAEYAIGDGGGRALFRRSRSPRRSPTRSA